MIAKTCMYIQSDSTDLEEKLIHRTPCFEIPFFHWPTTEYQYYISRSPFIYKLYKLFQWSELQMPYKICRLFHPVYRIVFVHLT